MDLQYQTEWFLRPEGFFLTLACGFVFSVRRKYVQSRLDLVKIYDHDIWLRFAPDIP